MTEKRFELSESVITDYRIYDYKQEDAYFISCTKHTAECLVALLNSLNYENEELGISIKLFEDDVKRLQEEITYWKHRVSSLLMILSQFDNEKVKKLLEELDEREEI